MLDLGIDLDIWPWVWLGVAVLFAIVELTVLGASFVLLPFAASAFAAALLGFYDVPIEIQWLVFLGGGGILWFVLYRYAQKWVGDNEVQPGVGADRLVGLEGIVTATIDPDDTERRGRVTTHGEVWGATSHDGSVLHNGTKVRVLAVHGTRVVVEPVTAAAPPASAAGPPIAPPPAPPSSSPLTPPEAP